MESPFVAADGDDLDLSITQKSTYTDPNGNVIVREPRAVIKLAALHDTIRVRDLQFLTKIIGDGDVTNSTVGSDPKTNKTHQTFIIGSQEINFDLSHEIYTITNSVGQSVEMPYVKVNPASIGDSQAKESSAANATGKAAVMRRVTVKAIPATRAGSITTETMYEVDARFSLELESVHTGATSGQTINFAVNYVGIVETVTELLDPVSSLSHSWTVKSGSNDVASPFVKTGDVMELWLEQHSRHVDEYGNETECHPRAVVKVSASCDTLWADDKDALSKLVEITATNADVESAVQKFGCGDQSVTVDWSYQTAESLLPYCRLHPVTVKSVTVERLPDATAPGRQADIYEVTALLSQQVSTNGVTNGDTSETVEYVVKYIGAVEVRLVKVEYRRDFAWIEAHDNIPLTSHLIVYRDRTYSNGETYTDTFRSGNCAIEGGGVIDSYYKENEVILDNGDKIILKVWPVERTDYTSCVRSSTGVPDLSLVTEKFRYVECLTHEADGTHLEMYSRMGYGDLYNPENPKPGWYFDDIDHTSDFRFVYNNSGYTLRDYRVVMRFFDRFLCVDDTIIDFRDMNMVKNFDFRTIDLPPTDTRGPAKVHISDCKGHYLGRDFYYSVTDTIYQFK